MPRCVGSTPLKHKSLAAWIICKARPANFDSDHGKGVFGRGLFPALLTQFCNSLISTPPPPLSGSYLQCPFNPPDILHADALPFFMSHNTHTSPSIAMSTLNSTLAFTKVGGSV